MEAKLVTELPEDAGWQFEPKWDGFRCLAYRAGDEVDLRAKSGKPLARYFPEVVALLKQLKPNASCSTASLPSRWRHARPSMRCRCASIPPKAASRRLASETPAILILFDMLLDTKGKSLIEAPLKKRRAALEGFYKAAGETENLKLSPYTLDRAQGTRLARRRAAARSTASSPSARRLVSPRRARDAQGEASAHRRLRGRRLPL